MRGILHVGLWVSSVPEVTARYHDAKHRFMKWWKKRINRRQVAKSFGMHNSEGAAQIELQRQELLISQMRDVRGPLPDNTKKRETVDATEWYLRAEVVKLTSHGILFNSLSETELEGEVEIFWPENHSLEQALHMTGSWRKPPTFEFLSFQAGEFFKLRTRFYEQIVAQDPFRQPPNQKLWSHILSPPGCLPRVDSVMPAERVFLVSIVPNTDQLNHVLTEKFNIGGKSGAPFYFTHDNRFIIKMIDKDEMYGFVNIFASYSMYFQLYPDTLVLRVYGCHSIKMRSGQPPYQFLVMANVHPRLGRHPGHTTLHFDVAYDLKGSTSGRRGDPDSSTMLDMDYLEMQESGHGIKLRLEDKQALMKQLELDCGFLASQGIMDYSLLVGKYHRSAHITEHFINGSIVLTNIQKEILDDDILSMLYGHH